MTRIHWFLSLPTILCAHSKSFTFDNLAKKNRTTSFKELLQRESLNLQIHSEFNDTRQIFQRFERRVSITVFSKKEQLFLFSHLLRDVKTFPWETNLES